MNSAVIFRLLLIWQFLAFSYWVTFLTIHLTCPQLSFSQAVGNTSVYSFIWNIWDCLSNNNPSRGEDHTAKKPVVTQQPCPKEHLSTIANLLHLLRSNLFSVFLPLFSNSQFNKPFSLRAVSVYSSYRADPNSELLPSYLKTALCISSLEILQSIARTLRKVGQTHTKFLGKFPLFILQSHKMLTLTFSWKCWQDNHNILFL